ncbi:hypothetical protein NC651_026826 [Populus alba x Populus x berolinensis]|nr:hypothetical protein NC651_026816 [Populus alba x Populus x berolinensis]KAJ6886262.1 hypothetical protein NC651_026826 [Populus alba x Populus x berolinensis]
MEIDSLHYPDVESISYTIDTFIIQLNQEDDDELESARVDVERNNLTTVVDMDNFELLRNSTLHKHRRHDTFEYERINYGILYCYRNQEQHELF